MKKVFVLHPMRVKTPEEIIADREGPIEYVKNHFDGEEVEIIDSYVKDFKPEKGCRCSFIFT